MLYIHTPFCKSRCIYCSFFSSTSLNYRDVYVEAVCREIRLRSGYLGHSSLGSIYLGGGTPSLLERRHFQQIFDAIKSHFSFDQATEITLECNPEDISEEFIAMLAELPFNRISLGVQSFCEESLRLLRRRHSAVQAVEAVKRLQEAGFSNISIDLIYALPQQSFCEWQRSVEEAISLGVQHISAYCLTYEDGTPLHGLLQNKKIEQIDEDESLRQYEYLCRRLQEAGFEHYEISNFGIQGKHSRHNSGYWQGKRYFGVGAAAHSFNGTERRWNVASIEEYISGVEQGSGYFGSEVLSEKDRFNEFVFLSLRTSEGISLERLIAEFGEGELQRCLSIAEKYRQRPDLVEITPTHIRLTSQGFFLADAITVAFFEE